MPVYLDHAATTPLRDEARDAWLRASQIVGNASSVHASGQTVRRLLEEARESVAADLDCEPIEVVFTSGGTESVNLAVKGLWWARAADAARIVVPDGEHHATLDAIEWLRTVQGAEIVDVPLSPTGEITAERMRNALRTGGSPTAFATALVANNEVGTVSDARALAAEAAAARVPLHLDAVGAVGAVDVRFAGWRGDASRGSGLVALSVSGHKVGAPVGTGALVVSRTATMSPLLHGGGQQRGLRAGTQDVAGAVSFAAALAAAQRDREAEVDRLSDLRDRLTAGIIAAVPEAELLGDPLRRLPGNVHVHFPNAGGESLLFLLDQAGISVSTGSACQAGVAEASHVVLALGRDERTARSVLRMTLGRTSGHADVDAVLAALPAAYSRAVSASR